MARQQKAKKTVDESARTVTFDFGNGSQFVAGLDKMSEAIINRLALHGLAQKLGDTYAGDVESPEYEVREMHGELEAGKWSTRAPGEPKIGLLAEALAVLKPIEGVSHEDRTKQAAGWLENATDEERKAMRKLPTVKAAIATIQARRARDAAKGTHAPAMNF